MFNEVITEACDDFRNQVCFEDTNNDFSEAACRVNKWQDCLQQEEQEDCENVDQRYCLWIEDYYYSDNSGQIEKTNSDETKGDITPEGICVPYYPPGFEFWGSDSTSSSSTSVSGKNSSSSKFNYTTSSFGTGAVDTSAGTTPASSMCSLGNAKITFKWTRTDKMDTNPLSFFSIDKGDWKCDNSNNNCHYLASEDNKNANISTASAENWAEEMNEICYKLGDCGGYVNWVGEETDDGYAAYLGQKRVAGAGGSKIIEKASSTTTTTGNIVRDLIKKVAGG
jgi:hypothetical protein